jgi:uncharacterized repeat protein (TIGR04076 family)
MKLSTRSRYGARLMLELARHYERGPVSLPEISKTRGISKKYLEQITIPLKKANYIKSVRGVSGGHVLAKPPDEITLGEIVAVLEGSKSIVHCEINNDFCKHIEDCVMHTIWEKSEKAIFDYLASINMADLLKMDDSREKKAKSTQKTGKEGLQMTKSQPEIGHKVVAKVIDATRGCTIGMKDGEWHELSVHKCGDFCGYFYHNIFGAIYTLQFGGGPAGTFWCYATSGQTGYTAV